MSYNEMKSYGEGISQSEYFQSYSEVLKDKTVIKPKKSMFEIKSIEFDN